MDIHINLLRAVALAASKDETRYYLRGVQIKTFPKGLRLAATDGHRMIVAFQKWNDAEPYPALDIILPIETIDKIKATKKSSVFADLSFDGQRATITHDETAITSDVVDGTFPAIERVAPDPKALDGVGAQFNPKYLMDFAKAMGIANIGEVPCVFHNGDNPAIVSLGIDAKARFEWFGVIMPFRKSAVPEVPSTWFCKP